MSPGGLEGRRVLVVGASAGIGRAFAVQAARAGAQVVVGARRGERLDLLAAEEGCVPVVADVTVEADCRRLVDEAVAALGAVDLVFYTVGMARLARLADAEMDDWRAVFDANVFGLQAVVRAVVPHLVPAGIVAALSSEIASEPRTALNVYGASKAALEHSLAGWRREHSAARFSCVVVGATSPTEFGDNFDFSVLEPAMREWYRHGVMQREYMPTDDVASFLVATYAAALRVPGVGVETLLLRSPSEVVDTHLRSHS